MKNTINENSPRTVENKNDQVCILQMQRIHFSIFIAESESFMQRNTRIEEYFFTMRKPSCWKNRNGYLILIRIGE